MCSLKMEQVLFLLMSLSLVFCFNFDFHDPTEDEFNLGFFDSNFNQWNDVNTPSSTLTDFSTCGNQTNNPSLLLIRKIINGVSVNPHSWPWQVLLYLDGEIACGGTILTRNIVITAAHCVITETDLIAPSRLGIGAGLHNHFFTSGSTYAHVNFIFPHPGFLGSNKDFDDIAVLFLDRYLDYGPNIRPICLPRPGEQPQVHEYCVVTGWGATVNIPTTELEANPVRLRQAEVQIVSDESCRNIYLQQYAISRDGHICALGGGVEGRVADTCQGDSGGPLQCKRSDGTWYLAGITSWGEDCGGATPGVYTQVENYLVWINEFF